MAKAAMKDATGRRLNSFAVSERPLAFCDRTFFEHAPVTNSTGASGISDGTQTTVMYKIRHKALATARSIELHYTNTKNVLGVETDGDNPSTVTASIGTPAGPSTPPTTPAAGAPSLSLRWLLEAGSAHQHQGW